jgi:tRNA-2-methylthio-N6-dimethylallyladenosine synthase
VPDEIASARLSRLQARHLEMLGEQMDRDLGRVHRVYIDELKPNGMVSGRSDDGKLIFVKGSEELLGKIVDVKITKTSRAALEGEVINP